MEKEKTEVNYQAAFSTLGGWVFSGKLGITVGGGVSDVFGIFGCVAELSPDDIEPMGSGVVLDSGERNARTWVLTAAHCLCSWPKEIFVNVGDRSSATAPHETRKVKRIFWQSGETYEFGAAKPWPASTKNYRDDKDRLALLELDSAFTNTFVKTAAQLPEGFYPHQKDRLIVVGWGVDDTGTYPTRPRIGVVRYAGKAGKRGTYRRNRLDLFNAMSRAADSGAPLFFPPMENPFNAGLFRLSGIHASRPVASPGSTETGYYLPLTTSSERWLVEKITAPQGQTSTKWLDVTDFKLRGRIKCKILSSADEFAHNPHRPGQAYSDWILDSAPGSGIYLVSGADVRFDPAPGGRVDMKIANPGRNPFTVNCGMGGVNNRNHWISGTWQGVTFYVFMLEERVVNGVSERCFRIEAFIRNSNHAHPGPGNIVNDPPTAAAMSASPGPVYLGGETQDDQDDHGNGHEPP